MSLLHDVNLGTGHENGPSRGNGVSAHMTYYTRLNIATSPYVRLFHRALTFDARITVNTLDLPCRTFTGS